MKKLNLYKIIGIFLSLTLFFIIFNRMQNDETDFKVDESIFNVYESSDKWEETLSDFIPQATLAKEIGAMKHVERRVPLLAIERDLVIHDVMVLNFGAVYLTYSFPLKEDDDPTDLPRLSIGSMKFHVDGEKDVSYLIDQQEIAQGNQFQPNVVNHRVYRADILIPNEIGYGSPGDFNLFSNAKSVILENIYVQENEQKVEVSDQKLSLKSDYDGNTYATANLMASLETKDGKISFTHFEAGLNANKLYMEGATDSISELQMMNMQEEITYSIQQPVQREDDSTFVVLSPFTKLEDQLSYQLSGIVYGYDGSIEYDLGESDWKAMLAGEEVELGEYSGVSYSILTKDDGNGQQLIITYNSSDKNAEQMLNQVYIESDKNYSERLKDVPDEEKELYDSHKPVTLGIKDKQNDSVLIYSTRPTVKDREMKIDFDNDHFVSGLPATITLSNLPDFQSANLEIKSPLKKNTK
ncbi:MAG: hypothetical protein WCF60_19770 [Anaerobacillus sp.]